MSVVRNIARRFGFYHREDLRSSRRAFAGAATNRITADWTNTQSSIDQDIRTGGVTLRNRARDLTKNEGYARRFVSLCRTNVLGPMGFKFQSYAREVKIVDNRPKVVEDVTANTMIEEAWRIWGKSCSVDGRHTFRSLCSLLIDHLARDGEGAVRFIRNKNAKYGLELQLIEPEAIDESYNTRLANGNVVKMGVELNEWRRPVAYYVRKRNPEYEFYAINPYSPERDRIPATDMILGFVSEYANQTRGFSWLAPSMIRLKNLAGYEEASVVKARVGAANMGFFIPPTDNPSEFKGDDEDASGNEIVTAEPGTFQSLPPGYTVHDWATEFPSAQYEMFVKSQLRGIASALGVSYNLIGNDLEKVNYSSIRAGLLDEREMWKLIQQFFVETFLEPIYTVWLESAMLSGALDLPMRRFDYYNQPVFIGRRWAWVDPLKDVEAKILEIQAGLTTATQVIAEQGDDIRQVYQELADEKALAAEYELDLKINELDKLIEKTQGDEEMTGEDEEKAMALIQSVRDILKVSRRTSGHKTAAEV